MSLRGFYATAVLVFLFCSRAVFAGDFIAVSSGQAFPETMSDLQNLISGYGYTVTRIQKVDEGLQRHGYERENYKVVFFGRAAEVRTLTERYPELSPFLPLNFVVFTKDGHTHVTTLNPASLKQYYKSPRLRAVLDRWQQEVSGILNGIQKN